MAGRYWSSTPLSSKKDMRFRTRIRWCCDSECEFNRPRGPSKLAPVDWYEAPLVMM
eukprot:SAG22_NODE_2998_length_2038_cov_1.307891_3_plen_56_part_00